MILRNISKNTTLAIDLKECVSFKDKNLGLLDPKKPRSLLFRTRFGIHTFGLGEPIDIVVLNRELKVVKLKDNLKPNRIFFWNPIFSIVIELPKETLTKSHTNVGDVLEIIY